MFMFSRLIGFHLVMHSLFTMQRGARFRYVQHNLVTCLAQCTFLETRRSCYWWWPWRTPFSDSAEIPSPSLWTFAIMFLGHFSCSPLRTKLWRYTCLELQHKALQPLPIQRSCSNLFSCRQRFYNWRVSAAFLDQSFCKFVCSNLQAVLGYLLFVISYLLWRYSRSVLIHCYCDIYFV